MSTTLMALVAFSQAFAQNPSDWQFMGTPVLTPDASVAWAADSVSSPSVVYDSIRGRYLMFFEARTPYTNSHCPQGIWRLGMATSPDGVSWTIVPDAVVPSNPTGWGASTYYNCVAAHPTAFFSPNNRGTSQGKVWVWFKSEQIDNACQGTTRSWGCGVYTGVGLATVCFDNAGDPYRCALSNTPVLQSPDGANMGTPKMVYQTDTWRMALGIYPDIYTATGRFDDLTLDPTPILRRSVLRQTIPWVVNEVFNPAQVCDDDSAGNMDLAMFVGGRETELGATVAGSWGKAISDSSVLSYMLDTTPQVSWTG
ncbi:MAG: hypothetical protein KC656_15285, partial [Myxococcales bacterium]|nr:hypothetical protein [Myxococcales bacterium]